MSSGECQPHSGAELLCCCRHRGRSQVCVRSAGEHPKGFKRGGLLRARRSRSNRPLEEMLETCRKAFHLVASKRNHGDSLWKTISYLLPRARSPPAMEQGQAYRSLIETNKGTVDRRTASNHQRPPPLAGQQALLATEQINEIVGYRLVRGTLARSRRKRSRHPARADVLKVRPGLTSGHWPPNIEEGARHRSQRVLQRLAMFACCLEKQTACRQISRASHSASATKSLSLSKPMNARLSRSKLSRYGR